MTEKKIIQHTTIEGQRWDQIATEYYGSPKEMNKIINANPGIPILDVLPGGLFIDIPIIEETEVQIDAEKLPPWKR